MHIYGIKPWDLDAMTYGEVEQLLDQLPLMVKRPTRVVILGYAKEEAGG